ncbi:diaminopimelate epimerase [Helicobacter sp.]|uniref:diaminopimelate epimerase n=1 Tax=Helicobacter sp. TaxID=218 RepID=UPI0019B35E3D|nr:diaminopimelate epimerase [Helicobacter sp.]MBD5165249.1 diaminopimelate epimerase [Helicobacter sp.]
MFFSKYSASGNDFIITHIFGAQKHAFDKLAQRICNRHQGVGADGLIILKPHLEYDFEWEFYNCDGSVAQMCGNGSRAAAMYAYHLGIAGVKQRFLTLAGVIDATIENEEVESALSGVKILQENICEFGNTWVLIDTGVPHLVCEKKGELGKEDLRFLRHKYNANVNIASIEQDRVIARTFERGVEDETLACGTGMAAMFYYLFYAGKIPNPCLFNPASKEDLYLREYQQRLYLKGKVHKICDFVFS